MTEPFDCPFDLILDTVEDGLRRIKNVSRRAIVLKVHVLGGHVSPRDKSLRKTRKRLAVMTYGRQAVEMAKKEMQ